MKIVLRLLAAAACAALGAGLLTGCGAQEEKFEERLYTADAACTALSIQLSDRTLQLEPSSDGLIHIICHESGSRGYDIAPDENGTLAVTQWEENGPLGLLHTGTPAQGRTARVQVPASLTGLSIQLQGENLALPALSVQGQADIRVNNGDLTFEMLDAPGIRLEVKNGDISGTVAGAQSGYSITSEVKKGENSLPAEQSGGSRALSVLANNGDVAIAFTPEA